MNPAGTPDSKTNDWVLGSGYCPLPARRRSFPILLPKLYNRCANDGGDRLRQGFERPTDAMPGYLMQLVKKRREKTIANSNEFALAA